MKTFLKSLAARDLRAFIALWASILGTMALTLFAAAMVYILWLGGWGKGTETVRIDKLGLIAVLIIVIMGVTMTSLGLAINRRVIKANVPGASFEASGGDEGPVAAEAVASAAVDKADEIKAGAKP